MKDSDFKKWYGSVSGIEVARNGTVRRRYKTDPSYPDKIHYYQERVDKDGNRYVLADGKHLRVDYLVGQCYVHNPGKNEFIAHNDRDKRNCNASNLQWVNPYVFNKWNGITDWGYTNGGFRVSKDGEVTRDSKKETIGYSCYDSDTDTDYAVQPYVSTGMFNEHRFPLEDLIAAAWLKYPDQTDGILDPALLHIDGDYKNCKLDNLKWVERDSEAYQDYLKRRSEDLAAEDERLNKKH